MANPQGQHNKIIIKLVAVVLGMFGFGFALVPLYDVFCDLTGLNGRTSNKAVVYEVMDIDESRLITVEFITHISKGMPWQFEVQTQQVKVHPGQVEQINFIAKNPSGRTIVGQAVPSVSPGTAAIYLNKIECFCFEQQVLTAGQQIAMPMRFYVDPQIPKDMTYFTVQYTLYDVSADNPTLVQNRG